MSSTPESLNSPNPHEKPPAIALLPTDFPIVLATANAHKVQEMQAILGPSLPIMSLAHAATARGLSAFPEPHESGSTFEQNAIIKAEAYARATGKVCLADDSGIEIDVLGTPHSPRPGVISSHYCTDGRETGMSRPTRDIANNIRVLAELIETPFEKRNARFVCVMCLVRPIFNRNGTTSLERLALVRGTFEGRIGLPADSSDAKADPTLIVPRGSNGFGYDPLFLVAPMYGRTSAELDPAEKNATSHRGLAAKLLLKALGVGHA